MPDEPKLSWRHEPTKESSDHRRFIKVQDTVIGTAVSDDWAIKLCLAYNADAVRERDLAKANERLKAFRRQHPPCCLSCYHYQSHPYEKCGRISGYSPVILRDKLVKNLVTALRCAVSTIEGDLFRGEGDDPKTEKDMILALLTDVLEAPKEE